MNRTKQIILFLILSVTYVDITAQSPFLKKEKIYFTWIKSMNGTYSRACFLTEIKDSSLSTMERKKNKVNSIGIDEIKYLQFRRKGKEVNGFFLGALTGFIVGGFVGFASGDDEPGWFSFTAEEKALILGVLGTAPGAIIGGIVGSAKVKIPINGSFEKYKKQKKDIEKFRYLY